MPGLSQLKQFEKDILSIGDEVNLRASRGEKPVRIPIPKEITVDDDSEDFVLGMPEIPLIRTEEPNIEEDLSDLTDLINGNGRKKKVQENSEDESEAFAAPDMSALLGPMIDNSEDSDSDGMPDLSMFMDEQSMPEEEQEEIPQEPEEISVADMGLDALLAGAGFDGSEGTNQDDFLNDEESDDFFNDEPDTLSESEKNEAKDSQDDFLGNEFNNELNDFTSDIDASILNLNEKTDTSADFNSDFLQDDFSAGESPIDESITDDFTTDDFAPPDFTTDDFTTDTSSTDASVTDDFAASDFTTDDFSTDDFGSGSFEADDFTTDTSSTDESITDDFAIPDFSADSFESDSKDDFSTDDFGSGSFETEDFSSDSFNTDTFESENNAENNGNVENFESIGDFDNIGNFENIDSFDNIDNTDNIESFEENESQSSNSESLDNEFENFDPGIFDTDSFDSNQKNENSSDNLDSFDAGTENIDIDSFNTDDFSADSFDNMMEEGSGDNSFNMDSDEEDSFSADTPEGLFSSDDLEVSSLNGNFVVKTEGIDDLSFNNGAKNSEDDDYNFDMDSESGQIPDYEDDISMESFDETFDTQTTEAFDTTGMDDMKFDDNEFESPDASGNLNDDFEGEEFAIPGFSDVPISDDKKQSAPKRTASDLDIADFSQGIMGVELPPNTLDDGQYELFMKNFKDYPLNVRLAFEDLIVQDEFTDDAEFEIIEKILNKAPARQVASQLEKMLDTSIPVPRDFEHRTASEYEAYKKSLQYQLKNKILPMAFIMCALCLVSWGLFNFAKNCIYIPAKASKYYKQGYTLLENDEYPLSQMKFDQAATLKMKKKWFFKYAQGYKEHKQYQRSADTYMKILRYFDHDLQAGLEYAAMELYDLSNYSMAEEITRRQVLDYHVNDEFGIMMLGDVYLEWGTEKDKEKLEQAKEQYIKLQQLYGDKDSFSSRLLKYNIRSDNLQEVINYQKHFEQKGHSLGADDSIELSGYLLEKLYGNISPSEEQLVFKIEGVRDLLLKGVKDAPENPVAHYNLSKYYIYTNDIGKVENRLTTTLEKFNDAKQLKKRDIYKFIDSYRLLGENYLKTSDYLQAQEQYTKGLTLYTTEKENAGFEGNQNIGKLYADLADINYLLAGDYENAAINYKNSVALGNDNPSIRYRLGYINYKKKNYQEALAYFMKAGEGNIKENNLLFAIANTLCLRNDDYAAEGYYEHLMTNLDDVIKLEGGSIFPQSNAEHYDFVNTYMTASNNYGVVLHKLAKRTGDSRKNAQSIIEFQQSTRAWDSLTRNNKTMVRLEGSNLAEENIKYVTRPSAEFEPSIYIDIPKTLSDREKL